MGRWTRLRRLRPATMAALLALTLSLGSPPTTAQARPDDPARSAHVAKGKKKLKQGLRVRIAGIPRTQRPRVLVTGPNKFRRTISVTTLFPAAKPGRYRIRPAGVQVPTGVYTPTRPDFTVRVRAKHRTATTVSYVPPRWASAASGGVASCGLRNNGRAWCWGSNQSGQMGVGATPYSNTPAAVTGTWRQLAPGLNHTCAIDSRRLPMCWGDNTYGQLGNPSVVGKAVVPTGLADPGTPATWVSLTTGGQHTCGIRTDRSAWCWGRNSSGQLGTDGSQPSYPARVLGSTSDWVSLSAGYDATCGVRANHTLWCWGDNADGQLGMPGPASGAPVQVPGTTWVSVSAGTSHACAIRTDHSLWCWGRGTVGELGNGSTNSIPFPVQVGVAKDWRAVSAGFNHTCGLRVGTLWCWGGNGEGQLGIGATPDHVVVPTRVGTAGDWRSIGAGEFTTCGLRGIGTAWCWGAGNDGQIGNDDTSNADRPTAVRGP